MKATIKFFLIIIVSQFLFGCGKKETAKNPSPKPVTITTNTDETTAKTVEATVTEPQQPEPTTTIVEAQQPAPIPESEAPAASVPQKTVELITAPPLKGLEWIKGGPVTFEPGKVYVIEFWATWCAPCKVSIPHLTKIQKQYQDKGVTVIGISTEEPETVKPFVKSMGNEMDYTVAVDVEGLAQKNYMTAFNKQSIPQAFLISGAGKIIWEGHPMGEMETVLDLVVRGDFDPVAYAKEKTEAAMQQQQAMAWYRDYFRKVEADGLTEEVKEIGANFIAKAPVEGLNAFAWNILMRAQDANRDLEAALKAAEKANQLTAEKDLSVLKIYALVLFETGKINDAIQVQQKAVDLASDYPDAQKQLRQTLEKYNAAAEKNDS